MSASSSGWPLPVRPPAPYLKPHQVCTDSIYPQQTLWFRTASMTRVLTMRYWPRGFRHVDFDIVARELAPSADLLRRYRDQLLPGGWQQFIREYVQEQQPIIPHWLQEASALRFPIVLLCQEHGADEAHVRCHRRILRRLLLGWNPFQESEAM